MPELKTHWENVHSRRRPDDVSWFQATPTTSLELIHRAGVKKDAALIDIGAGASLLVDHLLAEHFSNVSVLDIAESALKHVKQRLGERNNEVKWLTGDVCEVDLDGPYDLWHDRAVFHFLVEEDRRARYLEQLKDNLRPGGHAIIATFAPDGPDQCSNLPVAHYTPEQLARVLGEDFELIESHVQMHRTPKDKLQSFTFTLFRRRA